MRYTMLSAIIAVLGLYAHQVHAFLACSRDQPSANPCGAKINKLLKAVEEGPIYELCHMQNVGVFQYPHENTTFTIGRQSGTSHDKDYCVRGFSTIITQCIQTEQRSGGAIEDAEKFVKYEVSLDEKASKRDGSALEARAKKD
jgi:hypothetical protein